MILLSTYFGKDFPSYYASLDLEKKWVWTKMIKKVCRQKKMMSQKWEGVQWRGRGHVTVTEHLLKLLLNFAVCLRVGAQQM